VSWGVAVDTYRTAMSIRRLPAGFVIPAQPLKVSRPPSGRDFVHDIKHDLVEVRSYAFDIIEHDGEDLRDLPFLDREAPLARLQRDTEAGILLNEYIPDDGPIVFAHACSLGAEGIVSKKVDGA
jgi:ATP-dependent DNA ligase